MAHPTEPRHQQIPVTVNILPEPVTGQWLASIIGQALSLGLPQPRAFAARISDEGTPEILLAFDNNGPGTWDDLTAWADHHQAEVTAATARDQPGHWYAYTTFTRTYTTFTCSAYIPAGN